MTNEISPFGGTMPLPKCCEAAAKIRKRTDKPHIVLVERWDEPGTFWLKDVTHFNWDKANSRRYTENWNAALKFCMLMQKRYRKALPEKIKEYGNLTDTLEAWSKLRHFHDWICISPGGYDSVYQCKNCGEKWISSADNPASWSWTGSPCPLR